MPDQVDPTRPLYTISVVADVLGLHPESLREWERRGFLRPARRSGQRLYSDDDLRRLRFIQSLTAEGLNLAGVAHILGLYPCWFFNGCPSCMRRTDRVGCAKRCWREENMYCTVALDEQPPCHTCPYRPQASCASTAAH
ncbi:MAG: MerR family transcriptional regulator [Bacillota bacterium]|nr:MerR family transcriptional regulator [Bacillota bacterium]